LLRIRLDLMLQATPGHTGARGLQQGRAHPEAVIHGLMDEARKLGIPVAVDPKRKNFFTVPGC
jgi:hypothetical protein